jgi:hypothetical protein
MSRGAGSRLWWILGGVAVAAALAVVALIVVASGGDEEDTVFVNGAPLPAWSGEGADPAIGVKAPVFRAAGADGSVRTVGSGGGPADPSKVLLFVSPDCAGCGPAVSGAVDWIGSNELPDLVAVEIVVVDPDDTATAWLGGLGWSGESYLDSGGGTLKQAFGVPEVPFWVVHDRLNVVVAREIAADPRALAGHSPRVPGLLALRCRSLALAP